MPVTGTKPKPDEQRRRRNAPTLDWSEIVDVPYLGPSPALGGRLPKSTKEWWERLSSMPHCVLWAPMDWQFALDTARLHAAYSRGQLGRGAELRIREKQMGTTVDARRDLRIRYISGKPSEEEETGVTSLADYRAALE